MVIGTAVACALIPARRLLYSEVLFKALRPERLLFLGTNETVLAVARKVDETRCN